MRIKAEQLHRLQSQSPNKNLLFPIASGRPTVIQYKQIHRGYSVRSDDSPNQVDEADGFAIFDYKSGMPGRSIDRADRKENSVEEEKKELQIENLEKATGGAGADPVPSPMQCVCPKCGKFTAVITFYSGWMGNVFIQFQTIKCDNKDCNYFEQKPGW